MPSDYTAYRLRRCQPAVAIVGATGAVGGELMSILAERDFPVGELRLLASPRSAGKTLTFRGRDIGVEALSAESFAGIDLALFSAGSGTAREYASAGGAGGRHRHRQFLGLPHGPGGAAGGAGDQRRMRSPGTTASSPTRTAPRSSRSPRYGRSTGAIASAG